MKACIRLFPLVLLLVARGAHAEAGAISSGEYVIHNRMEILKPVNLDAMNTAFQTARFVSDNGATVIVDIDYYPLRPMPPVTADPNWKAHDSGMTGYLQPGPTANWDSAFLQDLMNDLRSGGIADPSQMTDVELVRAVTGWVGRAFNESDPFIAYFVDFVNGAPVVNSPFLSAFNQQMQQFGLKSQQDAFNQGVFGKGLYYSRIHGSCTPSAILQATMLRALGIPTRIVVSIPAVDANDSTQLQSVLSGIHLIQTRETMYYAEASSLQGFSAHTFNEVYLGGQWVRLNYDVLSQPIVDAHYLGLMTQVERVEDWSQSRLVDTWGLRYAQGQSGQSYSPPLSSVNPYRSLALSDNLDQLPGFPNPPLQATLSDVWLEGDPSLPRWIAESYPPQDGYRQVFVAVAEPLVNYNYTPLDLFMGPGAGDPNVSFLSEDHPSVLSTAFLGSFGKSPSDPHGIILGVPSSQGAVFVSGAKYSFSPENEATYRLKWIVPSHFSFTAP